MFLEKVGTAGQDGCRPSGFLNKTVLVFGFGWIVGGCWGGGRVGEPLLVGFVCLLTHR